MVRVIKAHLLAKSYIFTNFWIKLIKVSDVPPSFQALYFDDALPSGESSLVLVAC